MEIELSDLHINRAQNVLKAQFPKYNGFCSTLLQRREAMPSSDDVKNKVQIIHCNKRHHWIVATTVKRKNGQVLVIDLIYKSLDDETTPPVIKIVNPQRQKGVKIVVYLLLPMPQKLYLMKSL